MAATIENLPPEIMEMILIQLKHKDFEKCLKTSVRWKELAVHFCLKPHLKKIAKLDEELKTTLQEEASSKQYNDTDQILALYKKYNKARVLVITGGNPHQKMEIIDLVNHKIQNELLAVNVPQYHSSVGELLQGNLIICGGEKNDQASKKCFAIGQPSMNMLKKRACASHVVLNSSKLWVVGGEDSRKLN